MKPIELITQTNPILSDRVRLAIMLTLVSSAKPVEFISLLESLQLSNGNLSSHIQKLEDAKLLKVIKVFIGKKPKTSYSCTDLGRSEIKNYLTQIEKALKQTKDI